MLLRKLFVLFSMLAVSNSARILGIYHHPGRSHHKLGEVLFKALAQKGHEVVMVSPYPQKSPVQNFRDIFVQETMDDMKQRIADDWFQNLSDDSASTKTFFMILNMTYTQTELLFTNQEFMNLVKSKEKFDVIILDWLFNEAHLVLGQIFQCPIILSASGGTANHVNYMVGNHAPYSYVPYKYFSLTDQMSFIYRVLNTVLHVFSEIVNHYNVKNQQRILDTYIADPPDIYELHKHVALVFSNGHFSYESVRPAVPNVIDVGGYHVEEPKKLSKELKTFLDGATDGFIYFSLGSNMQSVFLDPAVQKGILNAFSKIPLRVLWKYEGVIEGKPANVLISKWLPQNDVLAHPKIKLFITHGGLLSTIESIYHGVPMIGLPMFGDQNSNTVRGVEAGYALEIKPKAISEATLSAAIQEMLKNPMYSENAKLRSDLLRNQSVKPLDRAIFWVEHVIKHKGADHLKNASMTLTWYQNLLLDVIAFIALVLALLVTVSYYIAKCICKKLIRLLKKSQPENVRKVKRAKRD